MNCLSRHGTAQGDACFAAHAHATLRLQLHTIAAAAAPHHRCSFCAARDTRVPLSVISGIFALYLL